MTTTNPFILAPGELPTPVESTENPFAEVGRSVTAQRLAVGTVQAAGTNPDEFGRWRQQAETLGVPADVAARNPADASRRALEVRLGQVQAEQPRLAEWLGETPERLALAQDQIEHLSFADRIVGGMRWAVPVFAAGYDAVWGEKGNATEDTARRFAGGGVQLMASGRFTYLDKVVEGSGGEETMRQNLAMLPEQQARLRAMGHTTLADVAGRVGRYFQGMLDAKNEAVLVQQAVDEMRGETDAGLGRGDLQYYTNRAADSGFVMALSLVTGGAARFMGASTGTAAWAAGGASGGSTYLDAYSRARAEGHSEDIADATATSQAVIEVLFERFGLAKAFGEAATVGRRALQTVGREAVGEGATTLGQTTSDALITGKEIDGAELGWEVFDATIVGGLMGGPEAVLGTMRSTPADRMRAQKKLDQVLRSTGTAAQLAALVEVARDAKLDTRAPDEARAFVDHLVGQSGAATHVYVDAAQFTTLYQSASLDPASAAADLTGDPDAYGRAVATGGDIAIPMNRYLTDVVRSAVADQIGQHARTSPDNLSPAELMGFKAEDFLGEILGLDAAGRAEASAREVSDEQAIREDVEGQLLSAKIEPGTAKRYAALYGSVFRTLARRTGKPATELWARYGMRIRRQTKGGELLSRDPRLEMVMDPIIDAVLAGKKPSDRQIYGDSLVAAIVRMGGIDPNSIGGGDLRAADANRRPGLLALEGRTVEAMAEALAQQDNFPDVFTTKDEFGRPDYRELIDLIRQELGGDRVYGEGNADLLSMREQIERVEAAMRHIAIRDGIDPATLPRAVLRERVLDTLGDELFQRTFHGTFYRGIEAAGFRLNRINTGEGAQLFGWGIYFTSSKGIAEWYRQTVTEKRAPQAQPTLSFDIPEGRQTLLLDDDGQFELANTLAEDFAPDNPHPEDSPEADEYFDLTHEVAGLLSGHMRDNATVPDSWPLVANAQGLTNAGQVLLQDMLEAFRKLKPALAAPPSHNVTLKYKDDDMGGDTHSLTWSGLEQWLLDTFDYEQHAQAAAQYAVDTFRGRTPTVPKARRELVDVMLAHLLDDLDIVVVNDAEAQAGQVYETDIPDDDDLLSWRDSIFDQPPKVTRALQALAETVTANEPPYDPDAVNRGPAGRRVRSVRDLRRAVSDPDMVDGADFYQALQVVLGSQQAASHALYEAGIPGLRYPAGQISGQKTDATNYVIWDESRMDVVRTLYQSAPSAKFAQWFGDSKVRNPDGTPMVVYHTGSFNPTNPDGRLQPPTFFTEDRAASETYEANVDGEARTTEAFLRITNPASEADINRAVLDLLDDDPDLFPYSADEINDGVTMAFEFITPSQQDGALAVIEELKRRGFDGARVNDLTVYGNRMIQSWVVFDYDQVASAADPRILYQGARSALVDSVVAAKGAPKKGDAAAWKQWLDGRNRAGEFKAEERAWMGLDAWLEQAGSVTREQLQEFVRASQLEVSEVILGEPQKADIDQLPFMVRSPVPGAFLVIGPTGSIMSSHPDADAAEIAAYQYSAGFLRSQGTPLGEIARGFVVARVDAETASMFGIDDAIGQWGLFQASYPEGEPVPLREGFLTNFPDVSSYARAVEAAIAEGVDGAVGVDIATAGSPTPAPYSSMTLPGGKNYRVMLLKLPEEPGRPAVQAVTRDVIQVFGAFPQQFDTMEEAQQYVDRFNATAALPGMEAIAAQLRRFPLSIGQNSVTLEPYQPAVPARSTFTGGHWQEPNVVAHVRFDERTDADGKRVLFVQEIQSDWHQQGRREGYVGVPNATYPERSEMASAVRWALRPATKADADAYGLQSPELLTHVTYPDGSASLYGNETLDDALQKEWRNARLSRFYNGQGDMPAAEWAELAASIAGLQRDDQAGRSVPDAPFKTTWHEMAMRRVVAYAAERGFDRVALVDEASVPTVEGWGMTLEQIKADPAASKRFGAILSRYSNDIPRFMKAFGKPFGAVPITTTITTGPTSDSIPAPPDFEPMNDAAREGYAGASDFADGSRPVISSAWVQVNGARQQVEFVLSPEGVNVQWADDDAMESSFQPWDDLGVAEPTGGREAEDKFVLLWNTGTDVEGSQDISLWDDGWDFDLKPIVREDISVPAIDITPAMREAAQAGLPLFQEPDDPRGSIEIGGDRQMRINLFERADLSTFLHESGHFFLEVLGDLAEADDATDQVKADYAALLGWMGVASRSEIGVEQHEQLARGFEAYLREGRSPNEELVPLFTRFRAWLTTVYRQLSKLNVTLTDEVRGVFDRLIATDEEIAAIEADQAFGPIGDRTVLGLSEAGMEAYEASLRAATEEARTDVTRRLLRAQQREAQAWWREELDDVRSEVAAELDASPVYRALSVLRTGKWPDGTDGPLGGARLSREALVRLWPAAFVEQRLRGLYAKDGGVLPDVAAARLGFPNGAAMVQALAEAKPRKQMIDALAKDRMAERHPDPLLDGTLAEKAMVAAHGNKRLAALQFELDTLADLAKTTAPKARVLRAAAVFEIGRQVVRSVKPNAYLVAERKAAREAARFAAKGRYAEAFRAKRAQALNAALYRQAQEALEQSEKAQRLGLTLSKQKVRAKFGKAGQVFLEQLDVILGQYAFGNMGQKEAERRQRAAVSLQKQVEAGTLVMPAHVMRQVTADARLRWDQLTVEQLTGLYDVMRQLQHQAREADKIRIGNLTLEREAVDEDMAGSVLGANRTMPENTGDRTRGEKLVKAWGQGRKLQGTASDLARELDGFVAGGSVWTHVVAVVRDAVTRRLNPALRTANEAVADLYRQHFTKAQLRKLDRPRAFPGIRGEWSHGRVLSLALNWGNEGNRQAILTQAKGKLAPEQIGELLGTLTAKDWDFVEAVWAHIDSYREAAFAVEQRKTGLEPERVLGTAFSVTLPDGSTRALQGGYFPLKYESDSVKSMHDEAAEYEDLIRSGRSGMSKVPAGSMITRVGSGGRTVSLHLGVVEQHIRDTLRIIHLSEPVNAASVALAGGQFRAAVADVGMLEHVKGLELWLKDVAAGEIAPREFHEKAARAVRQNFTASVLGFKLASALLQVTGILQTGTVLGWQATLGGVQQYVQSPKRMAAYVDGASPMMAARAQTHTEAVAEVMSAQQGRLKSGHAALLRWAYWMMGRVQRTVDISTWLAAEAEGMRLFDGDVDRARSFADDTVTRAQGSQEFIDKSPLQRGTLGEGVRQSEYIKATTMLAGYMLAKGNAAYEQTRKTNFRNPTQALRWAGNMTSLFVLEGMIAAAIKGAWPEDEEEDGVVDDVAWAALKEGGSAILGSFPGANTWAGQLRGYDGGGVIGGTAKMLNQFTEQVRQGEWDRALRKVTVNLIGVGTGAPSSQINKTLDALEAAEAGEDVSAYEYATGPKRR